MKNWKTGNNKLRNAFELLRILSSTKVVTASELGGNLNISRRSVMRLVDELTVIGIPINTTRGRGGGGFGFPKIISGV